MNGQTVWWTMDQQRHPPLRGRIQTEAVVIGGGLCGVTTALLLARGGMRVALLEADRLGSGASGQSLGLATVQHGLLYSKLQAQWGREIMQAYAASQTAARGAMAALIQELGIPCGFQAQDSCLAAMSGEEERLLIREEKASQAAGLAAAMTAGGECPFPVRCLLTVPGQAMLGSRRVPSRTGGRFPGPWRTDL